jgi:transcription initiation factor TFIIIB Brf1 subunit/transcription initiation factor TFIIB
MSVLNRISFEEIKKTAELVWLDQKEAEQIAMEAFEIITKKSNNYVFFNGRASKCILGGLFYLLGLNHGISRTQKEIAVQLGTNDVTIRVSYRRWLKLLPEFVLKRNQRRPHS